MKATIRNKFKALALPATAALALLASTADSEAGAYLKLGDIKGEATGNDHKEWINILSMSSPIARALVSDPASDVQRRRGDATLGDIVCVKELDKASPKIAEAVCTDTLYDEVVIHFTTIITHEDNSTTEVPYLIYKLKDVIVTSFSFHGSASGTAPSEEITLGYTEVEWTYITVDPKTAANIGDPVTGSCRPVTAPQ